MAEKIPDFSWLKDLPPPDPKIAAALAEKHAAKWDHQTWDVVISDREMILRHLERSCGGKHPKPFMSTEGHNDVAVGEGPTPKGLLYSLDMLMTLRDEGLVTSWKDGKVYVTTNSPSTTIEWWLGDEEFEGPGVLNGEEI